MLDWNGNGKIDPVDIGISVATEKETENKKINAEDKKSNIGCLTSVLLIIGFIAVIILFMF